MEPIYISYGVGNRVGNQIFLNENLKKHPQLHQAILDHEQQHSGGWDIRDLFLDVDDKNLRSVRWQYWKFILTNPKSWVQFLPIMKLDGKWTVDISLTIFWVWAIIMLMLIWILI